MPASAPSTRFPTTRGQLALPPNGKLALLFGEPTLKRRDVVLAAFATLDDWTLVVGGPVADGLEPGPRLVTFPGVVDDTTRDRLFAAADLVVLSFTPDYRNESGTLMDAIGAGKPVVCCDDAAAADVVVRFHLGPRYRAGDAASLADAVRRTPAALDPADLDAARRALEPRRGATSAARDGHHRNDRLSVRTRANQDRVASTWVASSSALSYQVPYASTAENRSVRRSTRVPHVVVGGEHRERARHCHRGAQRAHVVRTAGEEPRTQRVPAGPYPGQLVAELHVAVELLDHGMIERDDRLGHHQLTSVEIEQHPWRVHQRQSTLRQPRLQHLHVLGEPTREEQRFAIAHGSALGVDLGEAGIRGLEIGRQVLEQRGEHPAPDRDRTSCRPPCTSNFSDRDEPALFVVGVRPNATE